MQVAGHEREFFQVTDLFEIIPKGRTQEDKETYQFMRWYIRRHRAELKAQLDETLRNLTLYGYDPRTGTRAVWDNGEGFYGKSIVDQIKETN